MAKIAVIVSPKGISDAGGVERVMFYTRQVLIAQGYSVLLLDARFLRHASLGRSASFLLKGRFGFFWQSALLSYYAHTFRKKGAFVIGNGYSAFLVKADVLFCHGSMHGYRVAKAAGLQIPHTWKLKLFGLEEIMEMIAGQRAKKVLAVSPQAAREWQKYYRTAAKKIRILPNTVDTMHFKPTAASSRLSNHSSKPSLKVLFVGRLEWMKGIDRIKAFAEYCLEHHQPVTLTLVSPDARGSEILQVLPNISIQTRVSYAHLPDLYGASDVVYFPSRYEGFEMVTLEALACGIPVVGTQVGAIAYLLDRSFPGVYHADTNNCAQLYDILAHAASEWKDLARKQEMHHAVEQEFGIAPWSSHLAAIVGEPDA